MVKVLANKSCHDRRSACGFKASPMLATTSAGRKRRLQIRLKQRRVSLVNNAARTRNDYRTQHRSSSQCLARESTSELSYRYDFRDCMLYLNLRLVADRRALRARHINASVCTTFAGQTSSPLTLSSLSPSITWAWHHLRMTSDGA